MIDLYYWTTPNGHKVTIFLEEAGLKYNIIPVNIGKGEQFKPNSWRSRPTTAFPPSSTTRRPTAASRSRFSNPAPSCSIWPTRPASSSPRICAARIEAIQWLFWQMGGLGPMAGQNNHFSNYAPEKIPYAIDRYRNEVNRLYGVMNKRLADRDYLGRRIFDRRHGGYPWVVP